MGMALVIPAHSACIIVYILRQYLRANRQTIIHINTIKLVNRYTMLLANSVTHSGKYKFGVAFKNMYCSEIS